MLPLDVLNAACAAMSRDDLETLMLVNAFFRQTIQRDFAEGPFRFVDRLSIVGSTETIVTINFHGASRKRECAAKNIGELKQFMTMCRPVMCF